MTSTSSRLSLAPIGVQHIYIYLSIYIYILIESLPQKATSSRSDALMSFSPGDGAPAAVSRSEEQPRPPPFFFADATLDLEEAHGIADTPEAAQHKMAASDRLKEQLRVPNLFLIPNVQADAKTEPRDDNGSNNGTSQLPPSLLTPNDCESPVTLSLHNLRSISTNQSQRTLHITSARKPKWPRDLSWTIAFFLIIPISLLYPALHQQHASHPNNTSSSVYAQHPLSFATLHSITWTVLALWWLVRCLYRAPPGPEGAADRDRAAQGLMALAPAAVAVYLALALLLLLQGFAGYLWILPVLAALHQVRVLRHMRRPDGAWFHALASQVALDLQHRALRRAPWLRLLSFVLLPLQGGLVLLWRGALLGALSRGHGVFMILILLFLGHWLTATLRSCITYIVAAGILQWTLEQQFPEEGEELYTKTTTNGGGDDAASVHSARSWNSIPEAYRTVDASVYQSVFVMDDVLDDDDNNDDDEEAERQRMIASSSASRRPPAPPPRMVRSILYTGLTIGFGSMVQAGFWSDWAPRLAKYWSFLPPHVDYAMIQVAGGGDHPGFMRAARDVSIRIQQTGLEPVLQVDITTTVVSAVTAALSGLIVIITTALLLHQRHNHYPDLTDVHVAVTMLLSFWFAQTLIRTALEPLRAAMQASYVAFSLHPQLFLQTYPLIYHRLHRLTTGDLNEAERTSDRLVWA
jgi:hypothetical protein